MIKEMAKDKLQYFIAKNRRSLPLNLIAVGSERYLRAWYNENRWGFETNGEAFVLSRFNQWTQGAKVTLWDVGAHNGEWSETAHRMIPAAMIHSFEIIPELAATLTDSAWRSAHAFGLSSTEGQVDVHWVQGEHNSESSINPRSEGIAFRTSPVTVIQCPVRAGDKLVGDLGYPDLLKIDTEGHEAHVLRGFSETLRSNAPSLIQFEYGSTYVPSRSTLREIYALLPGYSIGRLYPNYVDFKSYSYSDEHLRMGNMIAARDRTLLNLLRG